MWLLPRRVWMFHSHYCQFAPNNEDFSKLQVPRTVRQSHSSLWFLFSISKCKGLVSESIFLLLERWILNGLNSISYEYGPLYYRNNNYPSSSFSLTLGQGAGREKFHSSSCQNLTLNMDQDIMSSRVYLQIVHFALCHQFHVRGTSYMSKLIIGLR